MARIFVVEDNESIREAVTGYLKLDDHEVVEFPGAAGVLEAVERREPDRITGFELGADDYVVNPFSPKELALRVAAVLRRSRAPDSQDASGAAASWRLAAAVLLVEPSGHHALVDGREIGLTGAEWEILRYLGTNAGAVMSRERILGEYLGYAHEGSERTVDTHVKNLRTKLGAEGWIQTVRGYGYRFSGEPFHG